MHHYNGEFGCPYCTAPGRCNGRGTARYYPAEAYPNRTHDGIILDGLRAAANESCVNGIYGPTVISRLHNIRLDCDLGVEYMHGISGTVKRLFSLWFSSEHHREEWYLGRVIGEIDKRMLSLRLPSWITRSARTISDHLLHWKAAELMNFFCIMVHMSCPTYFPLFITPTSFNFTMPCAPCYSILYLSLTSIRLKNSCKNLSKISNCCIVLLIVVQTYIIFGTMATPCEDMVPCGSTVCSHTKMPTVP
eukprot:Pompholyxophrys_sp_v1_NODE_49_length_3016_cov_4.701891.p3 type:complete len:248 gc:universal NODE_49_length_3016_cov_4.701891:1393-650(-)